MEFLGAIADAGQQNGAIHAATGLFQPIAADDVAAFVAEAALGEPRNGVIDIAGPVRAPLVDVIRDYLAQRGDTRSVIADPEARYFGGAVEEFSLVPTGPARLGRITLAHWLLKDAVRA
jgi:uncharacterized protein YbjT (DUF2867 family)